MNEKQQPAGYKMVSSAPYVATLQRYSSLTSSADACSFELKGLTTAEESLLAHVHTPHFHTFSSLLSHEFQHSILPFNMYASSHNAPALMLLFYIFAINSLSPVLFECPTHHRYSNFTTFTTLQLIPSLVLPITNLLEPLCYSKAPLLTLLSLIMHLKDPTTFPSLKGFLCLYSIHQTTNELVTRPARLGLLGQKASLPHFQGAGVGLLNNFCCHPFTQTSCPGNFVLKGIN